MKYRSRRIAVMIFALCIILTMAVQKVPPTRAVTLPTHIVINEFEESPVGGDYNKQWIEIYNPTYAPVNIGNWKIASISGTTVTIPTDTKVPANGYYVFMFTGTVLLHNNEMITLKDGSNNVVDVTAKKSKATASTSTWQRYPNGVDTNSDGDWQFRPATKWASNGGETVNLGLSTSSMVLGDEATLSGTVDPGHVTQVQIQASSNGGASWSNITIVSSTSAGSYSYIVIPFDVGTYTFRAVLPWDRGVLSNTVSLTVNKLSSQISIFTPRTVKVHESISLTGFISPLRSLVSVSLHIGMPNGTYLTRSTTTNAAGYFNFTFTPDALGRWNVTTSWSGDAITQGATSSMSFFKVEAADSNSILPLLLTIPVAAVLIIVLGIVLGKNRSNVPAIGPARQFLPGIDRQLGSSALCHRCGGPLVYSSQYQRWFCQRCRR